MSISKIDAKLSSDRFLELFRVKVDFNEIISQKRSF